MVGHGGSSAGSYLADSTSPIPSHCASIVAASTLRVKPYLSTQNYEICKILTCNPQAECPFYILCLIWRFASLRIILFMMLNILSETSTRFNGSYFYQ